MPGTFTEIRQISDVSPVAIIGSDLRSQQHCPRHFDASGLRHRCQASNWEGLA